MKRIKYLWVVLLFLCVACERDLMSYEGEEAVYFAAQAGVSYGSEADWPYTPYTDVDFVKIVEDETTVLVKVMITGPEKDYPRPFRVEVNPDSTTARVGVDYEPFDKEYTIEANSSYAYIPVVLHRQSEMKKDTITLGLKLLPNDYFSLTFKKWGIPSGYTNGTVYEGFDASLHTLRIKDIMVQPANWLGGIDATGKEFNVFGVFSEKKFKLICELYGFTYSDFMDANIMTYMQQYTLGRKFSQYLIKAKNDGKPVLEEDGRLMWVDGCTWDSFVGLP